MLFSILSKILIFSSIVLIAVAVYGYNNIQNSLKNSAVITATITAVDVVDTLDPRRLGGREMNTRTPLQINWTTTLSYQFMGKDYLEKDPVTYSDENKPKVGGVRRQGFWNQWQVKLRESLAHLIGFIMRRVVCDASVAF